MHVISNSCGIGLRSPHYQEIINILLHEAAPQINWLEVHAENFFTYSSKTHNILEAVTAKYPVSFHCVGLSLGSTDDINKDHLKRLKELVDIYNPALVSDHLAWSSVEGNYLHDLLPLPYNRESLEVFERKINIVQDYLGRQILIENPSLYITFLDSTMDEVDFLNKLVHKTNCGILLDINNIYISSRNLSYDPINYLNNINIDFVKEVHLAGFEEKENGILIDTHSRPLNAEVLELFKYFIKNYGPKPTLFEQDQNLGSLSMLLNQAAEIDKVIDSYR